MSGNANKSAGDDQPLVGYEVLLCLSGGIACYKSANLASRLVRAGAGVSAAMTETACRFVGPLTLRALTRRAVRTSLWPSGDDARSPHLSLTESADVMVIAPATADILAKLAAGLADELVSTMALSAFGACPILVAPSMNTRMWNAPSTQANMQRLRDWDVQVAGPAEGNLACGTTGAGRMLEPQQLLQAIIELLKGKPPKNAKR